MRKNGNVRDDLSKAPRIGSVERPCQEGVGGDRWQEGLDSVLHLFVNDESLFQSRYGKQKIPFLPKVTC